MDRWEERLEALFEGRPYDELDATLTDSLTQYPVDIQPFRWVPGGARAGWRERAVFHGGRSDAVPSMHSACRSRVQWNNSTGYLAGVAAWPQGAC